MKLIIDIDKELKSAVYNYGLFLDPAEKTSLIDAINNGTPIPDNATNGAVIKDMFPNEEICKGGFGYDLGDVCTFDFDWWNAPYQKGGKE